MTNALNESVIFSHLSFTYIYSVLHCYNIYFTYPRGRQYACVLTNRTSWLKLPLRSFTRSNYTCYLTMASVRLLRMKFNTFYILLARKVNKGLTQGEYKHVAFVQLYTCFTLNDICFVLNLTSQQTIKINEIVISSDW